MSICDNPNPPHVPSAAYNVPRDSPILADQTFYSRIGATTSRELVESFILPIRSGRAWTVPKGHICRLTTPEGAQVGDLNIWSLHNPRERFWAARTRQLHRSHVTVYDRLWSCLPYLRPLVTITGDSLSDYGVDRVGGRVHDVCQSRFLSDQNNPAADDDFDAQLLGTRCDPYGTLRSRNWGRQLLNMNLKVNQMLSGEAFDYQCHSNLTRAILPYGLTEFDVHDVLNVFQVTGLNRDGQYFMEASPAKPGDFFEFFAEIDILCALSTCPGGDLSAWGWAASEEMRKSCRPLGVEVYRITDPAILENWLPPPPASYKGLHGIKLPMYKQDG